MAERKSLSKRTRFEVFKRDQFKCQYCGAQAPDVLLRVDHIKPVADGGDDSLLNLITACEGCNAGKAAVPLSDHSAVKKQMAQIETLAERREQLEMLIEWRDGLAAMDDDMVRMLVERVNARLKPLDRQLNEVGISRVRGWLKRFGLDATLQGIQNAFDSDPDRIFNQMEQFAAAAKKVAKEPELREFWRIRARLRGMGFRYGPEWVPINDMRRAFKLGWTIEDMDAAAEQAQDYDEFRRLIGYQG